MRAMKDSGIPWIGMIPEGWTVCQYKRCVSINNGKEYSDIVVEEGGYPVMGSGGEFARASKYLYDGEVILMGRKGTIDKPLYFCGRFWSVDTMFYCIPKENTYPKYMYYQACTFPFAMHSISTALPSMTQSDLGNNPVVLPSLIEQQRIADFLDTKCAEIDEMIALQEKTVEELKAYKQSVITEAVTKGLNPDAPMKDSGIPWIGLIPQGWNRDKVVRSFDVIGSGTTPKSNDEKAYAGTINWIQSGDINGGILKTCAKQVSESTLLEYSALKQYEPPFLIMAMYGASVGNISISKINGCVNQACCVLGKCNENLAYMFYALYASKEYLIRQAEGGTQPNISQEKIKQLWLPLPPTSEQQAIASYLDNKCSEIDSLIVIKQQKAEELKTYKKSLIYEYVTGKKEVV